MDSRFELIPFMLSMFGGRVACAVAGEITNGRELNAEVERRNSLIVATGGGQLAAVRYVGMARLRDMVPSTCKDPTATPVSPGDVLDFIERERVWTSE